MSRVQAMRDRAAKQYAALNDEIEAVTVQRPRPVARAPERAVHERPAVESVIDGLMALLASASAKSEAQSQALADIAERQRKSEETQAAILQGLCDLLEVMKAPRKLIRDKRGKAIGAEIDTKGDHD